jgi:hypothetical protein
MLPLMLAMFAFQDLDHPILYDTLADPAAVVDADTLMARKCLVIYQSCDPESKSTGRIDKVKVLAAIDAATREQAFLWGMLDFEEPFFENLALGPGSAQGREAIETLVETMRVVRRMYPGIRWTYYGMPSLPYWDKSRSWDAMDEEDKRGLIRKCVDNYGAVVSECDWICPSVYLFYEPELFPENQREEIRKAGRIWRFAQVGVAKLLAKQKPVIPVTSPFWMEIGKARADTVVPQAQFVEDAVRPIIGARADGLMIWSAMAWKIGQAVAGLRSPDAPSSNVISGLLPAYQPGELDEAALRFRLQQAAAKVILRSMQDVRVEYRAADKAIVPASAPNP